MFEFSMNIYMNVLGTIFVKLNLTLDNKIVLYSKPRFGSQLSCLAKAGIFRWDGGLPVLS